MTSGGRSHEESLEEYILLAKGASGAACVAVINKALADPKVLVFGELMELPKVMELQKSHPDVYRLLDIFTYGTFQEYKDAAKQGGMPELNEMMTRKLKTLSIVNLTTFGGKSVLPYEDLFAQLDIPSASVRELEDLLIEAIAKNIISGYLNQQEQYLHVDFVMGRDFRKGDLQRILLTLGRWSGRCQTMLATLEEKSTSAAKQKLESVAYQKEVDERIAFLSKTLDRDGSHVRSGVVVEDDFSASHSRGGRYGAFSVGSMKAGSRSNYHRKHR